jgi:hypothetical protein
MDVMKTLLILTVSLLTITVVSAQDVPPRGPYNTLDGGIIDGVVIKDEVPIRSAVSYEHVRSADYVWSKRVFSRIDAREKLNHEIFFPFDSYFALYEAPKTPEDIDNPYWNKHQERWSLWTVIRRHILLGDLGVFRISDPDYILQEDGYQFKYPIVKNSTDEYFINDDYKKRIDRLTASAGSAQPFGYSDYDGNEMTLKKTNLSYTDWIDSLENEYRTQLIRDNVDEIKKYWDEASAGGVLEKPAPIVYQSSQGIVAYNIKEDWFFDKERSTLDKRIIAIAPVSKFKYSKPDTPDQYTQGPMIVYLNGQEVIASASDARGYEEFNGLTEEKEMFWLYFPELRNVIVNYYTYNNTSDAQWMSFDDLFWKRKFNSQIYRTSDKFDREIEDYRFGVDALREAEKIKGEIRMWEHDVWNY